MEKKTSLLTVLSKELKIRLQQVQSVIELTEEGNTIPFIARYRKERTGALDEVQIREILDRWNYMQNLEGRKAEVFKAIEEQGKLTEELAAKIEAATKLQEVEDLYRPYKQKRRTRASVAKEKGLEPFAQWLLSLPDVANLQEEAEKYINEELEVVSIEEVLAGGRDIVAEFISDQADIRKWIRAETMKHGMIRSLVKDKEKDEKGVYENYYDFEEPIAKIVPHRILAMNRGEKEEVLKVTIEVNTEKILSYLERNFAPKGHPDVRQELLMAIEDSYKRLIQPSIEREVRNELTERAEEQAIHIFAENLRNLLLQPPLKGKIVLGVDPAYRTGCKLAVVDETGKLLHVNVIYPHPPKPNREEAESIVLDILEKYQVEMIAIGNGTASRETEEFIAEVLKKTNNNIYYLIVNEAGASVYSASDLAREEFPNLQVEERSAVSIARRLQDPLAELVKIDPKSVGVGQYQHDVSQKKLQESLTFVVETVVNQVGVNVNTASPALLQYVSGLSKSVANNIVKYREENGKFKNRNELKVVPRLGAKTYEQCIGFLRILDGEEPLDRTNIHPENYPATKKLLESLSLTPKDIGTSKIIERLKEVKTEELASTLGIGEFTLRDILDSLMRPERDPRDELPKPLLRKDVLQLEDLKPGMELEGTVRNVVDFGAFVDIGVKHDGLVHISKMSNHFVKHPLDIVSVGDIVTVWVESVDVAKERISLTMIKK